MTDEDRRPAWWVLGGAVVGAALAIVLPRWAVSYVPPSTPKFLWQGDIVRTTLPSLVCSSIAALRDHSTGCEWVAKGTSLIVLDVDTGLVLLRPLSSPQRLVAWDGTFAVIHDIQSGGPVPKVFVAWPS